MSTFTVVIRQVVATPVTIIAASPEEAQLRAVCGDGDWGEPIHTEPEIAAVRRQEAA